MSSATPRTPAKKGAKRRIKREPAEPPKADEAAPQSKCPKAKTEPTDELPQQPTSHLTLLRQMQQQPARASAILTHHTLCNEVEGILIVGKIKFKSDGDVLSIAPLNTGGTVLAEQSPLWGPAYKFYQTAIHAYNTDDGRWYTNTGTDGTRVSHPFQCIPAPTATPHTSSGNGKFRPLYAIIGDISAIPRAERPWLHRNANGALCIDIDKPFRNEAPRRFRYWLYVADGTETRRLTNGNKHYIIPKVAGVGAWQPRDFYKVMWKAFCHGGCMPPVYCFVGGKWMTFGEPVIDVEKNEYDYVKALKPIEGDVPPIKRSWLPATVVCGDITRVPEELRLWDAKTGAICDDVITD